MNPNDTPTEERNDIAMTVLPNGVVNVHRPESDRAHSVILSGSDVVRCSCKGYKYHSHCAHIDAVETNPLVLSSASAAGTSQQVATDGGLPEITRHVEAPEYGGARYARCEGCGVESVGGADHILHNDECPHSDTTIDAHGDRVPARTETADFGGGDGGIDEL